ncbi:MAG: extracellular solute-binding protein, partial [Flavobacterium sp.]|nr:extracellular solute-binding protein [Flavobacterium sp.]
MKNIFYFLIVILIMSCSKKTPDVDVKKLSWQEIKKNANGQEVTMMMWMGDAKINQYMKKYIVPKVKKENNINLQIIDGQGAAVVQLLMTEKQANKQFSDVDIIWINGETFYQLKQIKALFGPWTNQLPNAKFIDFQNPFIGIDFQQPINGYELPWGNVQLTIIYNNQKVKNLPQTRADLLAFVKS